MIFNAALNLLAQVINRYLRCDPNAIKRLKTLRDHNLAIICAEFSTPVYVLADNDGVTLTTNAPITVAATLQASWSVWLQVAAHRGEKPVPGLHITGEMESVLLWQQFVGNIDIDWEEQLSTLFGDVIAHQTCRGINAAQKWVNDSHVYLQQALRDYLHEEIQLSPNAEMLDDFFADVRCVRDGIERAEARIKALQC